MIWFLCCFKERIASLLLHRSINSREITLKPSRPLIRRGSNTLRYTLKTQLSVRNSRRNFIKNTEFQHHFLILASNNTTPNDKIYLHNKLIKLFERWWNLRRTQLSVLGSREKRTKPWVLQTSIPYLSKESPRLPIQKYFWIMFCINKFVTNWFLLCNKGKKLK